jgi:PHD/YefM family antitoxin component YafN of YafNO toxin-antitoxin module
MQYLSVQEFTKSPQAALAAASKQKKIVLTQSGKASHILIKTDDKSLEMLNNMLLDIEFSKVMSDVQERSKKNGNSKMSMKEINNIISEVRINARKEKQNKAIN